MQVQARSIWGPIPFERETPMNGNDDEWWRSTADHRPEQGGTFADPGRDRSLRRSERTGRIPRDRDRHPAERTRQAAERGGD